ncbi:hypothetical protein [Galbibacter pacificus]|uniref:NodB homology domain-containing protein n=1 Tax=Galbibacter pacificus TaxID=2996052 RepID=A0ABT6FND9_9FLAO|nr:hypothetical protein [Galbibacter pacificus]MDG3581302.1 hypothetical protein [Galbibacter pacificus]MDG3584780.1 hypothetical protein [Galbibacter pacificus]
MNIYVTLDYELFFGARSGSVDKCIIEPTEALLKIVDPYNIKFVCFVDAGYLVQLERQKDQFLELQNDYNKVTQQIRYLADNGHGIELHVHPHWEDSYYDGRQWVFNTSRYKLSCFNQEEILDIVTRYNNVLKRVLGKAPVAYRAGGWSAQPFTPIKKALEKNNVFIDSTVYPNGYYNSANQVFNFRGVLQYKTEYNFSEDITKEDIHGSFKEIPISSFKLSPFFFWKFLIIKILKQKQHQSYGDGFALGMDKKEALRLLTLPSYSVVSIDGYKAKLLDKSFDKYIRKTSNSGNFVIIGHPKAFTPYSLKKITSFIEKRSSEHKFVIYQG